MIERDILPAGTELTPLNPMAPDKFIAGDAVRPWDTLSADEKKLFSRMAEVYAAFSEYTDVQIGRLIEFTGSTQGVIVSQGSRFGGYTLFVKNGKLVFVYNFLGITEQRLSTDAPALGKHVVGVEFLKKGLGKDHEANGEMTLFVDEKAVAKGDFKTQTGHYALAGEGLAVGYDSGDPVTAEYKSKFEFSGGRVIKVVYDVAADGYVNVERAMAAAMARD